MADKQINWTEQQQRAIAARGRNVLVTASAGTGKTAVLSGRAVDIVADAVLWADVLSMLVLTFTEAAAEQMRSRIARQLRDAYQQRRDPRLGRQLILLQGADISTIHSFCKRLITENFHALSLDPTFRVIDADEAMLLKVEVLDETIEWAWQQEDTVPHLQSLLRRRDLREDRGFLANVIHLSSFLDGVVSPQRWYEHAFGLSETADSMSSELGQAQEQIVRERLEAILAQLRCAYRLHESEAPGGRWGAELSEKIGKPIAACLERLKADDWDGCIEAILAFEKPRAPALKDFPETIGNLIKDLRTTALADFVSLRDLAVVNPAYLDAVGQSASVQSRVLVELTAKFRQLYAKRKAALNGLDFADLEHYALRLLTVEDDSNGARRPSETAQALRERYRYIFVDEYQDINPVQQAILDALGSGDNVFVVGDIKQSIYAWRGAEPTIFLQRLQAAAAQAEAAGGLRVDLNTNFRSAQGILDFVNQIFGRIMVASVANIDYDDAARLRPAAPEEIAPSVTPIVEMHILDEKADGSSAPESEQENPQADSAIDAIDPRQRQAAFIARRIREIVGAETGRAELQIYDKEASAVRDVQYSDIVVLMRSLAKKANDYVEILRLGGIPVSCDATAGYFETTEITDVVCLLKVLDNPQRDIEFAAVLRSPFFQLSETELAEIRIAGPEKSGHVNFYARAAEYRVNGPDARLRDKLTRVLDTLDQWRTLARRGWLADLLWRIYRDTQYIAFVCALPNGQARKANLLKLHDRAVQFEGFASSAGVPSLTRFVEFIERLQEAGQDWTPAEPAAAAGNAVRILSVHKSKGLEFPVVFLAELDSEFNQRDIQADVVTDAKHTLGLQVVDPRSNTKLRSLAHQVIGEKRRAVTLAEEMRILYVAMTRAKDHLILTASQKRTDCGAVLAKGLLLSDGTVPAWLLQSCKSPLEWVLYGLADQRALHQAFVTGLAENAHDEGLFSLAVYGADALRQLSQEVVTLRDVKARPSAAMRGAPGDGPRGAQLLAEVRERLEWSYPFAAAVHAPAKQSVTELTHQSDEFTRLDYSRALERRPKALAAGLEAIAPQDARLIGTAVHLVFSSLDLTQPVTRDAVEKTIETLLKQGTLTAALAERIDAGAVTAFFEAELGSVVLDKRHTVRREWPFTFGLPTSEAPDGIIVVQGIIDMLLQTPEGLLVIDFKTDRVTGADVARRAEAYRGQVELYARAASDILSLPVASRWLYFVTARQVVAI
ncbi:MAG: helicase-exonuclease AddAB subunit AddA [Sedimentisphaerales bacterium]|nr:helicase-exonuclease AddAB subunit AddA [Sedimentisphaerales bacterium]